MLCLRSLLIVSTLLIGPAYAETLIGVVGGVSDGDTITVLDSELQQHKVRLGGIDAPEKAKPLAHVDSRNGTPNASTCFASLHEKSVPLLSRHVNRLPFRLCCMLCSKNGWCGFRSRTHLLDRSRRISSMPCGLNDSFAFHFAEQIAHSRYPASDRFRETQA